MKNEMERKKNIIYIIAVFAFFIVFSGNIYNSVKSINFRRLCNNYREQLIATENSNRELTDRIGRVAEITGRIKETANANVTDARGIIELTEELRTQVYELESCLGSFNQLEYYSYWDNEFRVEGLME